MTPSKTVSQTVNQLVLATVAGAQARQLENRLIQDGFYFTEIASTGGILHEATVSMLIGLDRTRLSRLLEHLRECCQSRRQYLPVHVESSFLEAQSVMIEAEIGGATVYVFNVERFEQL
jgi:uncharacterized protein YaaQ